MLIHNWLTYIGTANWYTRSSVDGSAPLFKSNRNFFAMSKNSIYVQNIDLQFCELYYEVFCYEQVKSRTISFARWVSVEVLSQQSSKNAMLNWQISWNKNE